jgi:hypothetical protein
MSNPIQHPTINLFAPREYWEALGAVTGSGYQIYSKGGADSVQVPAGNDTDVILLQGIAHTGLHDENAICWALDEIQRRREERARNEVKLKEAEAVKALAEALRGESDQAFLERLLPRLTENTRYAVRNQLQGKNVSF